MKVSESWLREWVAPALDGENLASQLTFAGLEVDHVSPVDGQFTQVIVAHVLQTTPHPQADRLTLCEVDAGLERPLRIVCGATNVRAGLKVALAMIGAELPGGLRIKESKLRGELSQGMLCSTTELGLQDTSQGIIELPEDAPVGINIRDYLQLDDVVFDIDLTPNRADCFSVLGVAREVSALNRLPLSRTPILPIPPSIDIEKTVIIHAPEACPAYALRVIKAIDSAALIPVWMKERLRRAGLQSIHPVVDIVNYVMIELGQPMHAFDFNTLQGPLQVRFARAQESLTLLNQQTVGLTEQVLVIADEEKALAMAGIIGGAQSAVQAETTDILIESAYFNPLAITGIGRRYGLSTESSQRFERGVDPDLHRHALERVTALILSIAGGQAGPIIEVVDVNTLPKTRHIAFHPKRVAQMTGVSIAESEMLNIFSALGLTVDPTSSPWIIQVPSYRFDLTLEVDLVEEVIRLYGYDKLEGTVAHAPNKTGSIHPLLKRVDQIASFLRVRGYHEAISYSFIDPELQRELYPDREVMRLLNPISSELSEMRLGLWPGLLATLIHNMNRQQTSIRCFETGVVFERTDQKIQEHTMVGGILSGDVGALNWNESTRTYDFYDAKGDLQALFKQLHCFDALAFVSDVHPALHPGKTAQILLNNQPIGWVGGLHPKLQNALDLTADVILFEISIHALLDYEPVRYQKISKYPQIRRDLSLLMAETTPVAEVERVVRAIVPVAQLKSFDVFDQYQGDSLPEGKKSIAVALTLQDEHRTLVDEEINSIISAILIELEGKLNIILRD